MSWGNWDEGGRYATRVGDVLWLDQGQYHGRAPVEILDRESGEVLKRSGDVRIIGNFSPIWVNVYGYRLQLTEILRFDRSIKEEMKAKKLQKGFSERGIDRPSPLDWLPHHE